MTCVSSVWWVVFCNFSSEAKKPIAKTPMPPRVAKSTTDCPVCCKNHKFTMAYKTAIATRWPKGREGAWLLGESIALPVFKV